jgi:hypothetical protein
MMKPLTEKENFSIKLVSADDRNTLVHGFSKSSSPCFLQLISQSAKKKLFKSVLDFWVVTTCEHVG